MGTMINQSLRFYRRCIAAFDDKDVTLIISLGARIRPESLGILPDNIQVFAMSIKSRCCKPATCLLPMTV